MLSIEYRPLNRPNSQLTYFKTILFDRKTRTPADHNRDRNHNPHSATRDLALTQETSVIRSKRNYLLHSTGIIERYIV